MSSDTQRMPLISGSSHSSKYTRGRRVSRGGPRAHLRPAPPRARRASAARPRLAADHAAERADHAQDLRDAALVEHVHLEAGADQLGGDVGLQVGEAEHEVRLQRDDALGAARW